MKESEIKITELTYLFRIAQLIHEMDSINKIHRMLLSLAVHGVGAGSSRAVLLVHDQGAKTLKGMMGLEEEKEITSDGGLTLSFDEMTKEVFAGFERVESSDLTLLAKTFSVPIAWHRSALVKALLTDYPVLAEGSLSEFATDPFFNFFGTRRYIALPIKEDPLRGSEDTGRSSGAGYVLAVYAPGGSDAINVELVSILYGIAQQASVAACNLKRSAESDKRFRILAKIMEAFKNPDIEFRGAINLTLTYLCKALRGTGCMLKIFSSQKDYHVKAMYEYSMQRQDRDMAAGKCLENILERAAGIEQIISGDASYPLLDENAGIERFLACPLIVRQDVVGALAVYVEKADPRRNSRFQERDSSFLEISCAVLGAAIHAEEMHSRLRTSKEFMDEIQSNLLRERDRARLGDKSIEYSRKLREEILKAETLLANSSKAEVAVSGIKEIFKNISEHTETFLKESASVNSNFRNINVFKLVGRIAREWKEEMEAKGIEVKINIPSFGPRMLMDTKSIGLAIKNILGSIGSSLRRGDKAMVECSFDDKKVLIIFADTGTGMPGDLLSRLFMPFRMLDVKDEKKNALSLAGEIISLNGGEIIMKTSRNWRTIFILSFRRAMNRDRRKRAVDRRKKDMDRRISAKST